MPSQQRDVLAPFAEWWQFNRDGIQPVKQILPEFSFLDSLCEIDVRGGDHAHIHLDLEISSHRFELLFLENPQQFGLHRELQFADFVEQQGSAMGQLEFSLSCLHSSREGALNVTQKLAFEQTFDDCRAIDCYKQALRPAAHIVNAASDQLFACSCFADDQHGRSRVRSHSHGFVNRFHGLAFADHFVIGIEFGLEHVPLVPDRFDVTRKA